MILDCPVLVITLAMFSSLSSKCEAHSFYFKVHRNPECTYSGYEPGGGVPNIKPIQSPVAKAQTTTIAFITGKLAPHTGAATSLVYGAKTFLDVFANSAFPFIAGMGVFNAAMGLLDFHTKPSKSDLLSNVNKAFKSITEDVNNRLKKMEGYVDGRVIELERRLMMNEYRSLYRYWIDCLHEINVHDSVECQRNANRVIYSLLPHFQVLGDLFSSKVKVTPSYYDIKRLEAGLIPFRNYAALHVYALQLLVDSLKNQTSDRAVYYLKRYTAHLAKDAMSYYKYSHWAYNWLLKRQIEAVSGRVSFGEKHEIREGVPFKIHTADTQDVIPTCTGDNKARINQCRLRLTVRVDGKRPKEYAHHYLYRVQKGDFQNALRVFGRLLSQQVCSEYCRGVRLDLMTYWNTELLTVAEGWKNVAVKAANELAILNTPV